MTCCLIVTHPSAKFDKIYMPMSKNKYDLAQTQYNFDIENKGQGHTKVMKVCDTTSYGDTLM